MKKFTFYFPIAFSLLSGNVVSQSTYNWQPFASSMNALGTEFSNSRPLQYHDELNTVTFVHTKSPNYLASPVPNATAAANVIVVRASTNMGTSWDSTCLWNDNVNLATHPQGALYTSPGNTNIASAYFVGSGSTKNPLGYNGNWFASKPLSTFSNQPDLTPGASQFAPNSSPLPSIGKTDFAHYDFAQNDNGKMRSLGLVVDSINSVSPNIHGARILTGQFISGVFNWVSDSIYPNVLISSSGKTRLNQPHMAWNEAGTVGYVWFSGSRTGATGRNVGYQPIVYRTLDGGFTWDPIANINFNVDTVWTRLCLKTLDPVNSNTAIVIPMFNEKEGMDGVVDRDNRLHIVSTLLSTASSHPDSLHISHTYSMSYDGESGYLYRHTPGRRPYIFDFVSPSPQDPYSVPWKIKMLDSMASEAPSTILNEPGYMDNPWAADANGKKLQSNARIQLSRTPDGNLIICTWSESDTLFTNGARKWNHLPNVFANAIYTGNTYYNFPGVRKINLTSGTTYVSARAQMHHVASKCRLQYATSYHVANYQVMTGFGVSLPITVSNNTSYPSQQVGSQTHWYNNSVVEFTNVTGFWDPLYPPVIIGVNQEQKESAIVSVYPNPSKENITVNLAVDRSVERPFELLLFNALGLEVMRTDMKATGSKQGFNVSDLEAGVYFLKLFENGKLLDTKKVIRE